MEPDLHRAPSVSFDEPLPDTNPPVTQQTRLLRGTELLAAQSGANYVIAAEVQGQLSASVVLQAGLRLQRRYPGLRARCMRPTDKTSSPVIEFCAPDRRRFHFQEIRPDRVGSWEALPEPSGSSGSVVHVPLWHQAVERCASSPFDTQRGFMFRLLWMPQRDNGGYVVLSASEAVADETSLVHLIQVLLRECSRLVQVPALQRIDADWLDAESASPALLDLLPTGVGAHVAARVRRAMRNLFAIRNRRTSLPGAEAQATSLARVTRCRFESGAADNCCDVLRAVQSQGIELPYVLAAAAQFALARESGESKAKPPHARQHLQLALDVDMRHLFDGPSGSDQLGMFQGTLFLSVPVSYQVRLWDLVRALQEHGRRRLRRGAAMHVHTYCERTLADFEQASSVDPTSVSQRRAPMLHVGCASACALVHQYGPLSLVRTCVARSRLNGAAPHALWMHVLGGRFQYSLSSVESDTAQRMSLALLSRVVELVENIHRDEVKTLSLRRYVTSGI